MTTPQPYARQIAIFQHAHRLAQVGVWLGFLAILVFCVFGTLSSMAQFRQNTFVYLAFHYLPYLLVVLSVPISLYHAFLLFRYRIMQPFILTIVLLTGVGLAVATLVYWLMGATSAGFMSLFLTIIAWFAMPFLFRVNLARYLKFLKDKGET